MTRIPKILHYTFGMARDLGSTPWGLLHYVCLRSAIERIKPDQAFLYYEYEPSGPWWKISRALITPVKIEAPREIFGRPLAHFAHRSDVVRLQKLIQHGGIYLDADVLVQRSFDELLHHSAVLGSEGEGAQIGLANSVILAEPSAPFIVRWLNEYRSFRGAGQEHYWNEHSIQVPAKLAKAHPSEITVLPHTAFTWPLFTPEHLEWIFRSSTPIPLDCTYANHLWESKAAKYIEDLTPGIVRRASSNFNSWVRPFVADLPDNFGAVSIQQRCLRKSHRLLRKAHGLRERGKNRLKAIGRTTRGLLMNERQARRSAFQEVYKRNLWGSHEGSKFFSGLGSRGQAADLYVERITELAQRHSMELGGPLTIVDIGCGDFRIGRALVERLPDATYVGCDIVPELVAHNQVNYSNERVSFRHLDVVCDPLPPGHICLIRQVFQHLSNADISRAVQRLRYHFVYVTEGHPLVRIGPVNPDKVVDAGVRFDWREGVGRGVELNQPPYRLRTEEVFRVNNPPSEVLITERIILPGKAPRDEDAPMDWQHGATLTGSVVHGRRIQTER
jgi:hypothetical protein